MYMYKSSVLALRCRKMRKEVLLAVFYQIPGTRAFWTGVSPHITWHQTQNLTCFSELSPTEIYLENPVKVWLSLTIMPSWHILWTIFPNPPKQGPDPVLARKLTGWKLPALKRLFTWKIIEMCKVDPIFLRSSGDLTFHSARGASAADNPFQSDNESDDESSKWAGLAWLEVVFAFDIWYFRSCVLPYLELEFSFSSFTIIFLAC